MLHPRIPKVKTTGAQRHPPIAVYKYLFTIPSDKLPPVIINSEMVGREQELNKLHRHLADVIDGQGWVLNIIGEAGICHWQELFICFSCGYEPIIICTPEELMED